MKKNQVFCANKILELISVNFTFVFCLQPDKKSGTVFYKTYDMIMKEVPQNNIFNAERSCEYGTQF